MKPDEITSRLTTLIAKLQSQTELGNIIWEKVDDERYDASTQHSSFSIQTRDGDGVAPWLLSIYDSTGNAVASFDSGDSEYPVELRNEIRSLYDQVRNLADTDQIVRSLDKVLQELDELPPF